MIFLHMDSSQNADVQERLEDESKKAEEVQKQLWKSIVALESRGLLCQNLQMRI